MAYFERILRRANVRLMTMSQGQYELKRREDAENKKEKAEQILENAGKIVEDIQGLVEE